MEQIIYKITCQINGKVYIGQTQQTIAKRWKQHCFLSSKGCIELHRAIQKYGKDNFTVEQIDCAVDQKELDQKEQFWIRHYDSTNRTKGYNISVGGGAPMANRKHSEETRQKMSRSHTGLKMSEEERQKFIKRITGIKHSQERIRKRAEKVQVPVVEYDTDGKLIKVWASATIAARETGINRCCIRDCCRGRQNKAGGHIWRYYEEMGWANA